jgi:Na+-translocating ferredoxin:NAD+ oxidoreductase RnfA subunit
MTLLFRVWGLGSVGFALAVMLGLGRWSVASMIEWTVDGHVLFPVVLSFMVILAAAFILAGVIAVRHEIEDV